MSVEEFSRSAAWLYGIANFCGQTVYYGKQTRFRDSANALKVQSPSSGGMLAFSIGLESQLAGRGMHKDLPIHGASKGGQLPATDERSTNAKSLWVVVPAYNEAKSITSVVVSLRSEGYTVVVVDDGSADETANLARSDGAIVLQHCQNLGQGGALWTGITFSVHAGAQLVCTFDADGQHCVEDVRRMRECLTEDVDIVMGSRFLGSSPGISFSRRLLLRLVVLFTRLRSGLNVTDAHNGLRLMRATAAYRLDLKQLGMAHASEIVDRIGNLKLRWREVPVTIRYTEYSKRKGQSTLNSMSILVDLVIARMIR